MRKNKRRRSMFFVPAIKKNYLDKLGNYDCDAFIIDLEDSVDMEYKDQALQNLLQFNKTAMGDKEFIVRINSVDSDLGQRDLAEAAKLNIDSIMLPKVNSKEEISHVEKQISDSNIEIIPIIETLEGYFHREEILSSSTKITAVAFGAEDFCLDADLEKGDLRNNLILNKVICDLSLLAKRFDIQFIDCVFTQYGTKAFLRQMRREAEHTRDIGANGKLLIHPSQIEIANSVYAIDQSEIKQSLNILKKFDGLTDGSSTIAVNNVMMDTPSYKKAIKLINKAKKYGYLKND